MPRNEFMDHAEDDPEDEVASKYQNTESEIPELDLRGLWERETGFTTTARVLIEQQERRGEASE